MRWGLTHRAAKEFKQKVTPSNARIETVDRKWPFKDAWQDQQRCLIPIAHYYEWPKIHDRKVKHVVQDKETDGMVVAGLWESWRDKMSCTMITRAADDYMAQLHHRMLCYLSPDNARSWLTGEMTRDQLQELAVPNLIFYPANS
jgi:putative SOS response-associated peptidase YedK